MQRKYIVISSFFIAAALLALLCFGSFRYAKQQEQQKQEQLKQQMVKVKQTGSEQQRTNSDTKYMLEIYHEDSEELVKEEHTMPVEYVGMTRKEIEFALRQYFYAMPDEEYEAGLTEIKLKSFSKDRLVIRKTYSEKEQTTGFVLKLKDGEVAIYRRDGKELYELTGISEKNLPEDEKEKLKKGYEVENEKDLYSILENFSS